MVFRRHQHVLAARHRLVERHHGRWQKGGGRRGTKKAPPKPPRFTRSQVDTAFRETAKRGASAVRVFAFANGYGGKADGYDATKVSVPIQPRVGVFQEAGLARLDLVLAKAAQHGVRLILPLSNWWDELGGCQWYVDQVLGKSSPPKPKELFFTDAKVREAFADYIYTILTRVNAITGVAYKDDPVILAWELQNEPQMTEGYEKKINAAPGRAMALWVREMAAFIKALDSKHLVATGEEGWRCDGGGSGVGGKDFAWINDGSKGACFETHVRLPEIDVATVHVYASNWGFPSNGARESGVGARRRPPPRPLTPRRPSFSAWHWLLPNFVGDRAAVAAAAGKPVRETGGGGRPARGGARGRAAPTPPPFSRSSWRSTATHTGTSPTGTPSWRPTPRPRPRLSTPARCSGKCSPGRRAPLPARRTTLTTAEGGLRRL